jgi:hypothetical protein
MKLATRPPQNAPTLSVPVEENLGEPAAVITAGAEKEDGSSHPVSSLLEKFQPLQQDGVTGSLQLPRRLSVASV